MNLERFGKLSFLELRNGRLFTELGYDVTDEVRRVFELPKHSVSALAHQNSAEQEPTNSKHRPEH